MDRQVENELINAAMIDPVLYAAMHAFGFKTTDGLAQCLIAMAKDAKERRDTIEKLIVNNPTPFITGPSASFHPCA